MLCIVINKLINILSRVMFVTVTVIAFALIGALVALCAYGIDEDGNAIRTNDSYSAIVTCIVCYAVLGWMTTHVTMLLANIVLIVYGLLM